MRFFTPSVPAGRIEFLVILLITGAVQVWAVFEYLELEVDIANREVAFIERNLGVAVAIVLAMLPLQWISAMRRMADARKPASIALPMLLPGIGLVFGLFLAVTTGDRRVGFAPYGDDPYDPDSWVEDPDLNSTGPVVTYQGQELQLPGEERWSDDQAA